jgi:hypothetical protein
MRAATVIVGAIAVSSCLIALALVLTSGSSDTSNSSTPHAADQGKNAKPLKTRGATTASAPASGPVQCNVEVTVEGGSCLLGKNVLAAYRESGGRRLTALDPETGEEVVFECSGTAPTVCAGRSGINVYLAP